MEFSEVVKNRRSIRKFVGGEISPETIEKIVSDAQMAPSWKNSQVSRFYVALSPEKVSEFFEFLPWFNQNSTKNASAYVVSTVVNGISGFNSDGTYSTDLKEGYQYFDNGLAVENLCLSAKSFGFGTLIMGLFDEEKIREFFQIPANEIVVSVIALGHPQTNPPIPPRKPQTDILKIV